MTHTRTIADTIDALHTGRRVYKDCLYSSIMQADNAFAQKLADAVRTLEEQQALEERLYREKVEREWRTLWKNGN